MMSTVLLVMIVHARWPSSTNKSVSRAAMFRSTNMAEKIINCLTQLSIHSEVGSSDRFHTSILIRCVCTSLIPCLADAIRIDTMMTVTTVSTTECAICRSSATSAKLRASLADPRAITATCRVNKNASDLMMSHIHLLADLGLSNFLTQGTQPFNWAVLRTAFRCLSLSIRYLVVYLFPLFPRMMTPSLARARVYRSSTAAVMSHSDVMFLQKQYTLLIISRLFKEQRWYYTSMTKMKPFQIWGYNP